MDFGYSSLNDFLITGIQVLLTFFLGYKVGKEVKA